MEVFKTESLIRVTVKDKKIEKVLKWKDFKKSFWGNTEEGFHCDYFGGVWTEEELKDGKWHDTTFLVEDKKVYYRPYVLLTFVDGAKRSINFNAHEECVSYAEKIVRENFKNKFNIEYK